jgi:hypothetical protein
VEGADGWLLTPEVLAAIARERDLPGRTAILVGQREIPYEQVAVVRRQGQAGARPGAGSVSRRSPESRFIRLRLDSIQPGADIRVTLTNGMEVSGVYRGEADRSLVAYDRDYACFRDSTLAVLHLPALGESLWVTLRSGDRGRVRFAGFDHRIGAGAAGVGQEDHRCHLLAMLPGSAARASWDVTSLRQVAGAHGALLTSEALAAIARRRDLPGRTAMLLSGPEGEAEIPLERVSAVHGSPPPHAPRATMNFGVGSSRDFSLVGMKVNAWIGNHAAWYLSAGYGFPFVGAGLVLYQNRDGNGMVASASLGWPAALAILSYQVRVASRTYVVVGGAGGTVFNAAAAFPILGLEHRF